ncbi:MAG: carboxypeptidase regulatory-like domain-containing protein [Acidimicrobiales bacterium]|nr:carboxypeptidase regulatory-like domain-containing protein [Acidimicrobiales bacterium]
MAVAAAPTQVLSAGLSHTCAIRTTGAVTCWGGDLQGQSEVPAGTFTQVSGGDAHSCGIEGSGEVTCWGRDDEGQASPPPGTFLQVDAGGVNSCGVRADANAVCWGGNNQGVGTPPTGAFRQVSVAGNYGCGVEVDGDLVCWGSAPPAPAGTYTAVSVGPQHACALATDAALVCWGTDVDGSTLPPSGAFAQVAVGESHSCGVRVTGVLACWGSDADGRSSPPSGAFARVTAGADHSCAAALDGTVVCWGDGSLGQTSLPVADAADIAVGSDYSCGIDTAGEMVCGGNDTNGKATPPPGTFTDVDAYTQHTCAVRADATLACWGSNANGQATPPAGTFTAVGVGLAHSCGLRTDQTITCWGLATLGRTTPPAGTFTALDVGGAHSCALATDQTVACWGNDADGQSQAPVGTFTAVAAGSDHSCAVGTDARVSCWGRGTHGQSSPPSVDFADVAAGGQHSCGIGTDGAVTCWGSDTFRQLAAPEGTFTQVSLGLRASCAVRVDATLRCWGPTRLEGPPVVVAVGDPPTPLTDLRVWPTRFGATGPVTLRVIGAGLTADTEVTLVDPTGPTEVPADRVAAVPGGGVVAARFTLSGAAEGPWDVRVEAPGVDPVLLEDAVTVEAPSVDDLYVSLASRGAVRPGVPGTVTITVGNRGNTDALAVPVVLDGLPTGTEVEARFPEIAPVPEPLPGLSGGLLDPEGVPPAVDNGDGTSMAPLVTNVPANSTVTLPLRITVPVSPPGTLVRLTASALECLGEVSFPLDGPPPTSVSAQEEPSPGAVSAAACTEAVLETVANVALELVPGVSCAKGLYREYAAEAVMRAALTDGVLAHASEAVTGEAAWGSRIVAQAGSVALDCLSSVPGPGTALKILKVARIAWSGGWAAHGLAEGCLPQSPGASAALAVIGAVDPNEKSGPAGAGAAGVTTPDVPFDYTVSFENLASATAPAQTVRITDPVDTVAFDPDTISLGPISVAEEVVATPPPGAREWSTIVTLDGQVEPVGIDVTWDDGAGELEWRLTTLDPDTLEPTEDPFAGFLPPNVTAPEGEGAVRFSIEPRSRDDGTVLTNDATIVFDANEPIATNTVTNTLDGTPPQSAVDALPATTATTDFEVAWAGDDATTEVAGFEVWVAEDGGEPRVWRTGDATTTADTFTGRNGSTYEFWSVAWDTAGNKEEPPAAPDATTVVDLGTTGIDGTVRAPTGATVPGAWVAALRSDDLSLAGADVAGAAGRYSLEVPAGAYLLYLVDPSGAHQAGFHGAPTTVTVTEGGTERVDPEMASLRGVLTGTVTDAGTGAALPGAWALVLRATGPDAGAFESAGLAGGSGRFTRRGLAPGQHLVGWVDPSGAHAPRFAPDSPSAAASTPVAVAAGDSTTSSGGLPAQAPVPGGQALAGTVTDGAGAPAPGVLVVALRAADFQLARGAVTAPDGTYSLDLVDGTYFVVFLDPTGRHAREWYDDRPSPGDPSTGLDTATPVTAPGTADAELTATTGSIAGTITDADGGGPVEGAWVVAIGPTGELRGAVTGTDGGYAISGLAPGTYRATFADPLGGRVQEFWDGGLDFGAATPFPVVAGATAAIDADLAAPAS